MVNQQVFESYSVAMKRYDNGMQIDHQPLLNELINNLQYALLKWLNKYIHIYF